MKASSDKKISELKLIRHFNNKVATILSDYINSTPRLITQGLMSQTMQSAGDLEEELIYTILLDSLCGLDTESSEDDRYIEENYMFRAVTHLDVDEYLHNPYYTDLIIPELKFKRWALGYDHYEAYEAFVCDDIQLDSNTIEIPQIGYFDVPFRFPVITQDGREWMAIKPNEINTMQPVLDLIKGRVVAFGLGIGYFTYMATLKPEVEHITVVDNDSQVIEMFKRYILPQFKHGCKVELICCDAYQYIKEQMPNSAFDFAFVDLWHDVTDGLDIYLAIKKLERFSPKTHFCYWIEETLLSALRWRVFDSVIDSSASYQTATTLLSDTTLRKLAQGR